MTTRLLLPAFLFMGLGACASGSRPNQVDGGATIGCLSDFDCPDPSHPAPTLFMCNKTTGQCEPGCINKEDCSADRRGQYSIDACRTDLGGLGCQCDEGQCVVSMCSSDTECGARVCRNGACVAAPEASMVTSCAITPDLVVVKQGATVRFAVSAWTDGGVPVVPKDGARWTVPAGSPLSGEGAQLTAQTPTPDAGTAVLAVEATFGIVKCHAKAIVLPAAPGASEVYVAVTDELSGRPLGGLDVLLSKPDGSVITQGGQASVKTDARGLARLGRPSTSPYSVTVFGPDHAYVTIANYSGASHYLSIVTRRNQTDRYGGAAGTYTGAPASGNTHLGIAGMSLGGSLSSLSLAQLLGPSTPRDITVGGRKQTGVPIPAGVSMTIGDSLIKERYSALGLAGVCTDATGEPDEAAIAQGSCGTRADWSFVGDVTTEKLPFDVLLGGGNLTDIDATKLLSELGPIVGSFTSSVVRDVHFTLKPTPYTDGGVPDFSDESGYAQVNHPFVQVPLAFPFALSLPNLPKYQGRDGQPAYAESVLVIGAAKVEGRGLVPLGLGAAANADGSSQVDKQGTLASGLIPLRMAPTHHGLEGSPYVLLVAALTGTGSADASATPGASFLVSPLPQNTLRFDPSGDSPLDLTTTPFPVLPEFARFNFLDAAVSQIPPRSFRFVPAPPDLSQVSVVRVSFADAFDHRWEVLIDAAASDVGFTLPKPPGTYSDRLFSAGSSTGAQSSMMVHTQALETENGPLSFVDLVEVNDTNADRITDFLTAFAFLDYNRPTVQFSSPLGPVARVAKGGTLTLKVLRFKLGSAGDADGVVRLSFVPDTGCPQALLSEKQETVQGNGVVVYTLPMTCVGTDLAVKAELLTTDQATPVVPPVSTSLQLTID